MLGSTLFVLSTALIAPQAAVALDGPAQSAAPRSVQQDSRPEGLSAAPAADASGGLRELVASYASRVPGEHTPESWAGFAQALASAQTVLDSPGATPASLAAAKTALQDAAAQLVSTRETGFQAIRNNQFWVDTAGDPIYSQGGGVFRFGDTYYWYGVRYTGAESYRESPTRTYDREAEFVSVTAYSSQDLVNWTFEGDVATEDTSLAIPSSQDVAGDYFSRMTTLDDASWVGRLGVTYNENTGKYVLLTQMETSFDPVRESNASVLFLESDTPTGDFTYADIQTRIPNTPVQGTGDQTVFTDDDGSDYLVFSSRNGRKYSYVSRISTTDSHTIEPAVQVGYVGAGREGNAMFKLDGQYVIATSDLHGWNSSVTHLIRSTTGDIQGPYTSEYTLPGTEKDYSHVTQTGFFITVPGSEQDTVIFAGDRWADFAWNGIGYNQWLPLSGRVDELRFESLSAWDLNASTGEWSMGADNNYILNPEFAADRIPVSSLTGWTNQADTDSPTTQFVSNPTPGADSTRFSLRLGSAAAFSGSVSQENTAPTGVYRLGLSAQATGDLEQARIRVTSASGEDYVLDLDSATTAWQTFALDGLSLSGATTTVSIEARSDDGGEALTVDGLSLTRIPGWEAGRTYTAGDTVASEGSAWSASWWTAGQDPGDPNGPWQEMRPASDGTAVWTPSRIFTAGDVVTHDGQRHEAKWWTRNQEPGQTNGPWAPMVD
ncbi:hypothetical protein C5E16_01840 [Clavibacter michiganensis]|uniref:Chitin-binding type-3 domain-containing protein n=1 Tax=Clavibacter michiganensis TaxID=28447 RepID=A0A2S5VXY2_9MICO|nr:carbohydrate-binding protein [Clavibacter michiganensis]PPF71015.1 hypothetical protein C5E16_01840 [Clavibacter michiganensis]